MLWVLPRRTLQLQINAKYEVLARCATFKFMLVRYRTDAMLVRSKDRIPLEGKQRTEAKLRTWIYPVRLRPAPKSADEKATLIFHLPIHPELGTQFKLFAIPKSEKDIATVTDQLRSAEEITLEGPNPVGEIWFLLKPDKFPGIMIIKTIRNNIENNYVTAYIGKSVEVGR
jgi:hypothetical protein